MINRITNSIACFLSTFLNTNAITYSKMITAVMIIASIYNTISKLYGQMLELIPNMNNRLNKHEPTTLPIAISVSCFLAATIPVTNSGREVPIDTIVRPTSFSLIPRSSAMALALSTVN